MGSSRSSLAALKQQQATRAAATLGASFAVQKNQAKLFANPDFDKGKPSTSQGSSPVSAKHTSIIKLSNPSTSSSSSTAKKPSSVFNSKSTSNQSISLHPNTVRGQQNLSDDFGIATFTRRGGISTVPTLASGGFSDIDVGIGSFKTFDDFAEAAIQTQVAREQSQRSSTGAGFTVSDAGDIVRTQDPEAAIFVSDPREPQRFFDEGAGLFVTSPTTDPSNQKSDFSLDTVKNNIPMIAAGFIGLLVVMRLVKKI